MTLLSRRGFLRAIGLASAAAVAPALVMEPERQLIVLPTMAPIASGKIEVVSAPEIAPVSYAGINISMHAYMPEGQAWDVRIPGRPREILMSRFEYEALMRQVRAEDERAKRKGASGTMIDRVELQAGRWGLKDVNENLCKFGVGKVHVTEPRDIVELEAALTRNLLEGEALLRCALTRV